MDKKDLMVHKLIDKISEFDDFVIYGAGYYAKNLSDILIEYHNYPLYFLVTNMINNPITVNNIPVYRFEKKILELQRKSMIVIVAVNEIYEKDIICLLHENNIDNVVAISDFILTPLCQKSFENIYKNKDYDWYIPRIEEWYFMKYKKKIDFSLFNQEIKENLDSIVFVVNNFSPRVIKIVESLRERGREVIILFSLQIKNLEWENYNFLLQEENVEYYYYSLPEELIFLLTAKKSKIIHVFSNRDNMYSAYILIKLQSDIGKIIFESYDIINGFYTVYDEYFLELERYCLENAKGVCYREYSLEYLINKLGINISSKRIRFWDYCLDRKTGGFIGNGSKELSLCYAGGVITEKEYPDCPFGGFLEIAEQCEKNKCHLHIYPSIWDEKRYEDYIKKDEESEYFHFHKTIDYSKLINEISQYDYGILLTKKDVWEKETSGYNTKYKYIYAGTNKFFDYIDAGLPIIAAIPLKFCCYLEEKGALIRWMNNQYDFDYLREVKETMKKKVYELKEELMISNHIDKLLAFYDSI